jgi:hypothetical protein
LVERWYQRRLESAPRPCSEDGPAFSPIARNTWATW